MLSVIHTISTGLYGNAILSKDVDMVLRLLRDLIEIQIIASDNPKRYVRMRTIPFRCLLKLYFNFFLAFLPMQNVERWFLCILTSLSSFT